MSNYTEKYEMALDAMHFLIACCQDDIAQEQKSGVPDVVRLEALQARLVELSTVDRRLRINTESMTLRICEKYGAEIRARLASTSSSKG